MVTLAAVARRAGVSEGTASRVLSQASGRVPISAATRARVEQAARELDYHPNAAAQALSSGRARALAVVIREQARWRGDRPHHIFSGYNLGEGLSGLQEAAHEAGYRLVLDTVDEQALTTPLDLWKSRVVDGIVLWQLSAPPALANAGCPLLSISVESAGAWITADEQRAGRIATEFLLALGHRRIGFVGARTSEHYGSYQRLIGYLAAMHDAGFAPQTVPVAVLTEEEGQAAAERMLARQPQITAIVAMNDLLASGCLAALRERGLRVPHDVSLLGIDDQRIAQYLCPSLTTVRMPNYELGQAAARYMIALIETASPPRPELPSPVLIGRASTAAPVREGR